MISNVLKIFPKRWDKLVVITVERQYQQFWECDSGGTAGIQGLLFQARLGKQKNHPKGFSRVEEPGADVQIIRALDITHRGGFFEIWALNNFTNGIQNSHSCQVSIAKSWNRSNISLVLSKIEVDII